MITRRPAVSFSSSSSSVIVVVVVIFLSLLINIVERGSAQNVQPQQQQQQPAPVVTYDGRSLIINGSRELLFSGSIHYPRSTPDMWPDIIRKAKDGGLNVIQTYIFWNLHEPVEGQYDFQGNKDFVKFIRMVGEQGLWVTLRFGPYIEAEWNFGGFPYWLKQVPNITFRTYNEPFIQYMKRYTEKMIGVVKEAKLFADQGGPIILAQIENEYNTVQLAYREDGIKYVKWAADMATSLYSGVPWVMCKQKNAPPSIISTCNGRQCGDTFAGPGPNKPSLWTENWTAQYKVYGDSPSQRAAEDIAFAVARFFSRNGTLTNYYMYHGGTNFGRSPSSFVTTRYYDEAPLDEFGLPRDPKYGHLRDLHRALRLSKKALLKGTQNVRKISNDLEVTTYEKAELANTCAAFLTNNNTKETLTINFRGLDYSLPPKSISILPDCKTVVFNTQKTVSQHSSRNYYPSSKAKVPKWEMFREKIPDDAELTIKNREPRELYDLNQDTTDYAWYSTRIELDQWDLPMRADIQPVLQIASLGHALLAFVNGQYIGFGHGNNVEKSHVFRKSVNLRAGQNHIAILALTVGLPNSGAYMEKRFAGPKAVTVEGLMSGTLDITGNEWAHQVGLSGEKLQVYTEEGAKKVQWVELNQTSEPLTWYKGYFDAPEGDNPIAIRLSPMQKGMVWINGVSIGRYWVSYLSPLGKPTQEVYHIPRSFLKPTANLIVILEETGGNPQDIEFLLVNRDTICSIVSEDQPTNVRSFEKKNNQLRPLLQDQAAAAAADPTTGAAPLKGGGGKLICPDNKVVEKVEYASFGNGEGACGAFKHGTCESSAINYIEKLCLGKPYCTIPFDKPTLLAGANDPCPDVLKKLAVQVKCASASTPSSTTAAAAVSD